MIHSPAKTGGGVQVVLPWPARALSPNERVHWAVKAKATKEARNTAKVLTMQAMKLRPPRWTGAHLHWEFHPKTRNLVDGDNAESACKTFRDGIADALRIDDSKFEATRSMGTPVKGGSVVVTISPLGEV